MCGITGYIDFNSSTDPGTLIAMTNSLSHRGPDDSGTEYFGNIEGQIGLGFRRLSIIDLSPAGHQPMYNDDHSLCIVFNGEIYNYREIKVLLEKDGIKFKSDSDTEVLLRSYEKWGSDCVNKFIGMFAVAIYDANKNILTLIRDRAGVKPLYYYWRDQLFLFGSELKAFHKHPRFTKVIDFNALGVYFQDGYISAPHCIYKGASKLQPGHRLEVNLISREVTTHCYWSVHEAYNKKPLNISFEDACSETEKLLVSAFQYRMIADVPVGVFLSGGFDSSAVAAILQTNSTSKINTFTIGFEDDSQNEAAFAKKIASHLGTEHHEQYCREEEAMAIIPSLGHIYDEPFADSSAIPTILVSRIARESVTVALSADGGDEAFAGYYNYPKSLKYIHKLEAIPKPFRTLFYWILSGIGFARPDFNLLRGDRFEKLRLILHSNDPVTAYHIIKEDFTEREIRQLIYITISSYNTPFNENNLFNKNVDVLSKILCTDYKSYMCDDILQKVDRATMSVSLEGREPLIDHRIIEWAAQLPSEYKLQGLNGKRVLKEIVYKYIPRELMDRPKKGFTVPVDKWCQDKLKNLMLDLLSEEKISLEGIFNPKEVTKLVNKFLQGDNVDFQRIWKLMMFELWYAEWVK